MKKLIALLLAVVLAISVAACGGSSTSSGSSSGSSGTDLKKPKVGFVVFDYSNAFMAYVRKGIENYAKDKLDLEMVDSANDQTKQNEQITTLLSKGVDMLIVNVVDAGAGKTILDQAKAKDVPVVFINRAPQLEILKDWDKCWYVGIAWESPGLVEADMVKADWTKSKDTMDKNKDGKLQYVLVQGNISQQDGIYRTKAINESFQKWNDDKSMPNEQLDMKEAGWDTTKAKELMGTWLTKYGNKIEAVVSNNDAMAMGVIEALRGEGYYDDASKKVFVYGINALPQVMPLLEKGELAGTVLTSPWLQAVAAVSICSNVFNGKDALTGTEFKFSGDSSREIRVPDSAITKANAADATAAYNQCS